jgi:hypothetical protein
MAMRREPIFTSTVCTGFVRASLVAAMAAGGAAGMNPRSQRTKPLRGWDSSMAAEDTDTVLRLLRMLPPRERLRVVAEVLPELEGDLPATPASPAFWQSPDVQALAEQRGVEPGADLRRLLAGWPEEEPIDESLTTLNSWPQDSLEKAKKR